jgi:adenylate cyclase
MKLIIRWARWFGLARAVCIVLLFALVPLRVIDPRPLEEVRLRAFDLFQVLRPREQTARPVVIVDIDEASLKEIGQWPWPRTVVADLVNRLNALGAVVIGFDVVFPEPDRMSPAVAAESFRGIDAETREKLAGLPSNVRSWRKRSRRPAWSSARPARRYRRRARRPRWRCRPASPSRGPIRPRSW